MLSDSGWIVTMATFGGAVTYEIQDQGDVVIGAHSYKKYVDPIMGSEIFIREDVVARKVYKNIDGNDVLFWDFTLETGSMIELSNGEMYEVQSIENINVLGGQRKRFYLNRLDGLGYNEVWIEGVGNSEHPLLARFQYFSDPVFYLECSSQNSVYIYNRGLANGVTETDCSSLGTVEHISQIGFAPNPFNDEMTISSTQSLANVSCHIYNSLGQLVRDIENNQHDGLTIRRENLNAGIYYLRLMKNGKSLAVRKIIITD